MLVKELLGTRNDPVIGTGISFFVGDEIIMTTPRYEVVAPLFDGLRVKKWGFDWDSQSIEIELYNWDATEYERKVPAYVFINDEPTEKTKRLMGLEESEANPFERFYDGKVPSVEETISEMDLPTADIRPIGLENIPTQLPSNFDNLDIRNLTLTKGTLNRLNSVGIASIGELREFTREDLLSIRGMGKKHVKSIEDALYPYGLCLKES